MAETLGIVASAVTVAELAVRGSSAVFRLKALWDEIQQ